jgi:tetratricopeptide (TPR) repeat protein
LLSDGREDSLGEAIELYRGPFLADLEIPEDAWTEWVGVERGRLESLALDAMVRLGSQHLQAGRSDEALSVAHRAVALSNLREDAHRLLIQALAAQGRRAEALRHYDQLVRLLRRELSTDPDAATTAIATELRRSTPADSAGPLASNRSGPVNLSLPDAPSIAVLPFTNMSVRDAEINRARAKPTENLTAYDFYLRALPAWYGQTELDYKRTQVLLSQALEVDPEYAEALGTLTDSVTNRTMQGWHESWPQGVDEASRLAGRALVAGPDNSTCVASAAFAYGVLSYRFDEAFELADRALMVHPNSVFVCNRAAAVYVVCGESDKAITQCEAACRMNPLDSKKAATFTYTTLSAALYMARRYDESIRAGRRVLAFAPQVNTARKYVATSLAQLGRTDEARVEIAELLKFQPGASVAAFQQQPFRHKWMTELHTEGLRKAGLRAE